jgi:hypothetical protein
MQQQQPQQQQQMEIRCAALAGAAVKHGAECTWHMQQQQQ